jgi:predicted nucleic acid-binding protein
VIVLDTNVVSEPLRRNPDAGVLDWLGRPNDDFALTAVSVSELLTGVGILPIGRRRDALGGAVDNLIEAFAGAVLAYDERAARAYAALKVRSRESGRPIGVEDGMIAAICIASGATLATRNLRDFEGFGVDLVNPWELPGASGGVS